MSLLKWDGLSQAFLDENAKPTTSVDRIVMCGFGLAWREPCENPKPCSDHAELTCQSCGATATHQCDETMGPFVCGCNLCDDCEHEISEDGTNGGNFKHCRKDAQKHKPWYMREST
jgi:hypothetical protein